MATQPTKVQAEFTARHLQNLSDEDRKTLASILLRKQKLTHEQEHDAILYIIKPDLFR